MDIIWYGINIFSHHEKSYIWIRKDPNQVKSNDNSIDSLDTNSALLDLWLSKFDK